MLESGQETLFLLFMVIGTSSPKCLIGQEKIGDNCRDCPIGRFSTNGIRCEHCTICKLTGQITREACSAGRDTTCSCPDGKFLNGSICITCKTCPMGYQQLRGCAHNRDRICEKCPEGLTTNSTNSKKCFKKVYIKPDNKKSSPSTVKITIVITSSVLGFLVIVSAISLVLIRRKLRKKKQRRMNRHFVDDVDGENIPLQRRLLVDDGNTAAHRKVRDLPAHIYEELGIKLNPERTNNWIVLAGHLGITQDMIGVFKLDPLNATQSVLNDWSTTEDSTVLNLFNILIRINREDAANIVEQYVYT